MALMDIRDVIYSSGIEIVHPGGLEKSKKMAADCSVSERKKVLNVSSRRGATAFHLAKKYGCEVTGVDDYKKMIDCANERARKEGLTERVGFQKTDMYNLPFDNDNFDIVLAECSTVFLDKEKAFPEFLRVLKSGGYIGDLEFIWKKMPPAELAERIRELWGGFTTMDIAGWEKLYRNLGLKNIKTTDFSDEIPNLRKHFEKQLGPLGVGRVMVCSGLSESFRETLLAYNELMIGSKDYLGYAYIVSRKN